LKMRGSYSVFINSITKESTLKVDSYILLAIEKNQRLVPEILSKEKGFFRNMLSHVDTFLGSFL
jgi:hypothetical protein